MDIFIRNVPNQASDRNLEMFFKKQLQPFGIQDFCCQKLKSRGCGILTLLNARDGQRFLDMYGSASQIGLMRTMAPALKYMDRVLICSASRSKPDVCLLQTLRKDAKDRGSQARTKSPATSLAEPVGRKYQYTWLSCGIWDYQATELVFVSQCTDQRMGSIVFGKQNLVLVTCSDKTAITKYRLDIPYSSVQTITTGSPEDPSLTITLSEAPRVYHLSAIDPLLSVIDPDSLVSEIQAFGFFMKEPTLLKRRRMTSLGGTHERVIGSCFVYRVLISDPGNLRLISQLFKKSREIPPGISWPTSVIVYKSSCATRTDLLISTLCNRYNSFPYGLQFQVQKLAQNGCLEPTRVFELLPYISQVYLRFGRFAAAEAVRKLSTQVPFAGPDVDGELLAVEHLGQLLEEYGKASTLELSHNSSVTKQHPSIALIHKVSVTPAGIYLAGPDPETKNRVLRAYPNHIDNFIRVTFSDEDGEQIAFDRFVALDEIFHSRFKKVLDEGISIAGRCFAFLGFSHSSLRCQTCWFMAPFEHNGALLKATDVISKLGDFSTIRSPAKCAARIGQAFSNTDAAVKISLKTVHNIPDIERNGRVFSDGVGTVSADTLAILWKEYAPAGKAKSTLHQIRFAGAKGMISLDTRLKGEALLLRQSMIKYTGSNASDIEICGLASRTLPMYLNRQYIKIMEDLGVGSNVFMELQNNAVERLRRTTLSAVNAATFLERELVGQNARVPWLIRKLVHVGFEFQEDPFLRGIVELAVLSQLRELKHRSRIFVEKAVTLYGIMDETDTLAEGEIYCCTDRKVITGIVVITRAPALHPGDIQVANAVDVPADSPLNALHNCIVFSQQGQRDLPSQLSGGDLDGDMYSVIYDPRLLPPCVVQPANYPRVAPKDIGRLVTRKDMTDFFVDFMENDQLGRIAMIHMQMADRREGGTRHPDCITLAEMHSTAVDFSKTGIPVDMKKCPKYDLCRPDFMAPSPRVTVEKGNWTLEGKLPPRLSEEGGDPVSALDPDARSYRYYESEKILGKLYRAIDEKNFLAELQRQARELEATDGVDQTLIRRLWVYVQNQTRLIQWDHYREWAHEAKEAYEMQLLNTIYQYSTNSSHLISELEVFVGTLLGKSGGVRNHRLRQLSAEMKEAFGRAVAFTVDCIVKGSEADGKDEALERSIACMAVAVEAVAGTPDRARMRLVSFQYVAAAVCLGEVDRFQRSLGLQLPL